MIGGCMVQERSEVEEGETSRRARYRDEVYAEIEGFRARNNNVMPKLGQLKVLILSKDVREPDVRTIARWLRSWKDENEML